MEPASGSETRYCAECGRPSRADELARFGDVMICPACKDQYAQKLREGAARPAAAGYAGFWIRVVAYLIDVIILGIVGGVLQLGVVGSLVGFPRIQPGQPPDVDAISRMMGTFGLLFVLQTAIASCYEAFFVSKLAATPGKLVIGAKVLRPDGSPVSLGRAFGRYFAKYLSTLALFIGFIMVGFDSQKRGLHDMICDTRVFRSRS